MRMLFARTEMGQGTLTGLATDPVKEIISTWTERDRTTSSLAYLVDLPRRSPSGG